MKKTIKIKMVLASKSFQDRLLGAGAWFLTSSSFGFLVMSIGKFNKLYLPSDLFYLKIKMEITCIIISLLVSFLYDWIVYKIFYAISNFIKLILSLFFPWAKLDVVYTPLDGLGKSLNTIVKLLIFFCGFAKQLVPDENVFEYGIYGIFILLLLLCVFIILYITIDSLQHINKPVISRYERAEILSCLSTYRRYMNALFMLIYDEAYLNHYSRMESFCELLNLHLCITAAVSPQFKRWSATITKKIEKLRRVAMLATPPASIQKTLKIIQREYDNLLITFDYRGTIKFTDSPTNRHIILKIQSLSTHLLELRKKIMSDSQSETVSAGAVITDQSLQQEICCIRRAADLIQFYDLFKKPFNVAFKERIYTLSSIGEREYTLESIITKPLPTIQERVPLELSSLVGKRYYAIEATQKANKKRTFIFSRMSNTCDQAAKFNFALSPISFSDDGPRITKPYNPTAGRGIGPQTFDGFNCTDYPRMTDILTIIDDNTTPIRIRIEFFSGRGYIIIASEAEIQPDRYLNLMARIKHAFSFLYHDIFSDGFVALSNQKGDKYLALETPLKASPYFLFATRTENGELCPHREDDECWARNCQLPRLTKQFETEFIRKVLNDDPFYLALLHLSFNCIFYFPSSRRLLTYALKSLLGVYDFPFNGTSRQLDTVLNSELKGDGKDAASNGVSDNFLRFHRLFAATIAKIAGYNGSVYCYDRLQTRPQAVSNLDGSFVPIDQVWDDFLRSESITYYCQ